MKQIPVTEKLNLSIKEAAAYTGVGERRLREMCKAPDCDFCLHIGSKKTLIKRKRLEAYLSAHEYID